MTYWSRSRNELWVKGDTSGHHQYVKSLTLDCDMDTILGQRHTRSVQPAIQEAIPCFFQ